MRTASVITKKITSWNKDFLIIKIKGDKKIRILLDLSSIYPLADKERNARQKTKSNLDNMDSDNTNNDNTNQDNKSKYSHDVYLLCNLLYNLGFINL